MNLKLPMKKNYEKEFWIAVEMVKKMLNLLKFALYPENLIANILMN